jgi:hypothetical protein
MREALRLCFNIPCTSLTFSREIFFVSTTKKNAERTESEEYRGYSSDCETGAHSYSERGIHQLIPGLAEALATVY